METYELNMDGLVGPTHNYSGLSAGNVASVQNAMNTSSPQAAALQGLEKMRLLYTMGLKQAVLPPHQRPNLHLLHQLGFSGSPAQQIAKAYKASPELLGACCSASSMWAANAATVSASADTADHKVHFTAANLIANIHRHQEADFSRELLAFIFANPDHFQHHELVPRSNGTGDEGAANHNRLCQSHAEPGINLFVYGKKAFGNSTNKIEPIRYPARQSREASESVARSHQLNPEQLIFAQQNPEAIDKGVFHNDVIAVANESVLLIHQEALHNQQIVLQELKTKAAFPLHLIEFTKEQLSIEDAVQTYLFNSQLLSLPQQNTMVLVAPSECQQHERVRQCIEELIADPSNPVSTVHYLDLKQSMRNGGGPACLRLRVPLNEHELAAMHQSVLINHQLLDVLKDWVLKHYRTELKMSDLADPQLIDESFRALDELTQLLNLGSIYPFQKEKR